MASDDEYVYTGASSNDSNNSNDSNDSNDSFSEGPEDALDTISAALVETLAGTKRLHRHSGDHPSTRRKTNKGTPVIPVENIKTLDDLIKLGESYDPKAKYSIAGVDKIAAAVPALKKLTSLHGMDEVKQMALRQIKYMVQGLASNEDFMHMVVYGAPGAGKTTVINILGEIFAAIGFLKHGKVHAVTRADLIGKYVGHTAPKTLDAIRSAFGGVLLIDEFYSLGSGKDSDAGFDRECIDTLNQALSEHRSEFICVVAGYQEEIEKYIWPINKGLRRRFPWQYTIGNYTTGDLLKILETQLVAQGWTMSAEATDTLRASLDAGSIKFVNLGGDTESLLTKCKIAYGDRIFGTSHDYVITGDDMVEAIKMFKGVTTPSSADTKWEQEIKWRMYM